MVVVKNMMCCDNCNNVENKKTTIFQKLREILLVIGVFAFLIIGCAMFRKAEDRQFTESSMFCLVEDNSYWAVYYHKDTKVMWIRNKGSRGGDFEVLVDRDGKPIIWSE